MKVIGAKWTVMVLRELYEDKKRFGELLTSLSPISPRTLSARLSELERHGIIKKKIYAEVPLHVEYYLTPRGESLKDIILKIHDWGARTA